MISGHFTAFPCFSTDNNEIYYKEAVPPMNKYTVLAEIQSDSINLDLL